SDLRTGYLCDIADQSRKSLGQMPARFVILEYEIDADLASATLTRRETVEGRQVFGPQFGYVEQRIKTLEDFNRFQSQVDDVTYAAVREGAVVLGGRRIPGRAIRGLKTADIAALWQAEDKLTVASQELKEFTEQKERELKARWEHVTYRRDDYAEKARLERKIEADRAVVHEEIEAFRKQHHSADSLGFSLDPAYDYQRMADFVERYLPRVPADPSKLTEETDKRAPYRELLGSLKPWAPGTNSGRPTLPASEVAAVAASLRKGSTREFFSAL